MQRIFGWVSSGSRAGEAAHADSRGESEDEHIDGYEDADDIYETDDESEARDELAAEEEVVDIPAEEIANQNGGVDEELDTPMQQQNETDSPAEEAGVNNDALEQTTLPHHDTEPSTDQNDEEDNELHQKHEPHTPPEEAGVNNMIDSLEQNTQSHNDVKSTVEKNEKQKGDMNNSSLSGEANGTCVSEAEQFTLPTNSKQDDLDEMNKEVVDLQVHERNEIPDDSFPKAQDFLVDMHDDAMTLADAAEIVEGFNDDDDDDDHDDAKTIATHRTTGTKVQPVSAAFRCAMAQKEEAELKSMMRHPHQSIFDILNRNFEELGDGSSRGGRQIGYKDVKLCFVAFVAVFSLPSEPIFANDTLDSNLSCDSPSNHEANGDSGDDDGDYQRSPGEGNSSTQHKPKESILQRVPLSVAFELWNKVLQQSHGGTKEENSNDHLSYIRSTLVLLGMLDLASIERDRDDGVSSSIGQSFGYSNRTIECLVVHDSIHQQYGEYLAWGDHEGAFRSLIGTGEQQWNEAVLKESKQIGSNQYTLRMLPLNTMRANHMQETFNLLNDKTFVRRRIRVLGASGAAKAHVGDIDELLVLIEKQTMNGHTTTEPIDEQEGLLGAYQQVLKYCLHDTEELTKCHKDEEGNIKLGKSAMYRTADIGNALHLLGASLGGYGFFDEEMEYYKEALRIKKLAVNGDINRSVSASDTLHSMGFSLDNSGKSEEALECYDRALGIRYECLGDDDLRVAETQHNKGALLCELDRAEEALECLEEALHIREIHYGEEHESCADTMQWMGNLLRKHGNPSDALDYFKFALSIKQKRLGGDDIDVANTLFNTAVLLDDIEKYELSLVAYKEALRIRKLVLGEHSPEVADNLFCMGNVATVVDNQQEALGFYKESIDVREALIHGDDHVAKELDDTLLFISNPTSPHPHLLPQYEKLNQSFEEALPLTKLIMGTNHPDVCDLLNRMGEVYMKLHDWDNAIGSFQGALRVKKADAPEGQDDIEVAALLQKKGEAHLYKNEFIRAKATFDSAMQMRKMISGADSLFVASSAYCLGVAYYYLNDFSHAKLLFQECMRIQSKLSGDNDPCIVRSLCWLGRLHEKLSEPQKALERYLSALQRCKQEKSSVDYRVVVMLLHAIGGLYEDDRVNRQDMALKCYIEEITLIHSKLYVEEMQMQTIRMLADAHFNPGMLYKKRDDSDNSIEHLEKALELSKQCEGEKSIRVATITDNLGVLYASRKEFSVAKNHYSSAYSVYEKAIGREDLTTSDCAFRLGKVLDALESDLAMDFYKESLRVHKLNMTDDDERVGEILFCEGSFFLKRSAHHEAVKCFEEALGIRKRLLGDCLDVADTYHKLGKSYNEMSQNEKALIFYQESVRINKKGSDRDALYKVSLDMAQCATACSNYQLALDCYTICLQGTKSLDNKETDTALVLQQMGEMQMNKLQNYSDATKLLLDALEILRGIEDEDGEKQNIMDLLLLIAQAYASAKDFENSLDYYEEYNKLLESNADENEDLLADSFYAMGNIFAAMDKNPDYDLAIEKIMDCLDIKKKIFDPDDEQCANVVYTLATIYEKAGCHDKATETHAEALRSFKMKQNKAGSVKVYHALARLKASKAAEMDSLPERSAAIECYKEALKIRRQIMSLDDIELASILYEYATLLCMNNEHDAATFGLLEEALRIQKTKNGLKDEGVANTLLRMAEVHVQQQKYEASLVSLEQVLFIQSSLDGDNDIDMGSCHYLLGTTYLARGDFQKAISSYLECMKMKEKKFGCNSLECAAVHNDLGQAYGKVKEYDKAIESLVHALKIRKTELGNNALDYAHSVLNLAMIHIALEKCTQALNCLSEAIRVYELFPNDMSEKLVEVVELKGDTLYENNDYDAAVSMFQEIIDSLDSNEKDDSSSQGSHHVYDERVARVNCKMGHAFAKLEHYEEALESYMEAISIFSHVLGKNHVRVGEVMYDLGLLIVSQGGDHVCEKALECFNEMVRIYRLQGKGKDTKVADALVQKGTLIADCSGYDEAASILDEAIDIYKEALGEDAAEIGKAMLAYARIHDAQGNNDEAMTGFDEALRIFQMKEDGVNVSLALSNIGIIHARKLEYAEAVEKCKTALKMRVTRGEQDRIVADSVFNIGNILNDWGKEDEAYQFFQQALKLYIHLLGVEDISVANCQQKLGTIYWNRKDVDQSLDSFLRALRICEEEDEDEEGGTLASIYRGIGDCYYNKGEYEQALEHFAKCLRILKMDLGDDCIEMAAPCHYIGLIYQKQEKYEQAMNFHSKALLIQENHHGKGSHECSSSDFQVAKVLLALHQYEECVARLRGHLETFCKDSEDNEEVADVYHPLGLAQGKLGEYEDSITSLKKALEIRTKLFGKTKLKVAETMLDLGKILEESGDSEEAIAIFDQAITVLNKIPDSDIQMASAYSCLGALLEEKGNNEASLHAWKQALKLYSSNSGSDSMAVGEILYHLGSLYDELENFGKSTSCFSESVKIFRSKAEDNEMVGKALGLIGKNYARKKQYAKAVELSTESLRLQKQFAQAEDIAGSLLELGNILKAWGKADQASQFFEEALRTYEEALGTEAVEVAACRHNIGILKKQLGESEIALRSFGESLRVYRMKEGDKSLHVANNLFQIGLIYEIQGESKSHHCFEECLKIREEILGEEHFDVMAAQRLVNKTTKYQQ